MDRHDLGQWLTVMRGEEPQPSDNFIVVGFPSDELRDEYMAVAHQRPAEEVQAILRTFVGANRPLNALDRLQVGTLVRQIRDGMTRELSEFERRALLEFAKLTTTPTWEGVTWILDLLPHRPGQALEVLSAYTYAHAQVLADLRLAAIADAADLIRTRYITRGDAEPEVLLEVLLGLDSRDFEFLVAAMYRAMGYQVHVTPAQKDGGRDVILSTPHEVIFVECKNWRGCVPVGEVTKLAGRIAIEKATRGILVGTAGFTTGHASATEVASAHRNQLTLLAGVELILQLNEHLGAHWHRSVERIIHFERRRQLVQED